MYILLTIKVVWYLIANLYKNKISTVYNLMSFGVVTAKMFKLYMKWKVRWNKIGLSIFSGQTSDNNIVSTKIYTKNT